MPASPWMEHGLMKGPLFSTQTSSIAIEPWHRSPGARAVALSASLLILTGTVGCRIPRRIPAGDTQKPPGATIGHDFNRWPKGTTIPPAGLGVDLVGTERGGSGQALTHPWIGSPMDPQAIRAVNQPSPTPQPGSSDEAK